MWGVFRIIPLQGTESGMAGWRSTLTAFPRFVVQAARPSNPKVIELSTMW